MTNYVYSTASNDSTFIQWLPAPEGSIPVRGRSVVVKGGANVIDKNFVTPRGVVTSVTDEELSFLESLPSFNRKVTAGFYTVQRKQVEVEKVVKSMTKKDKSAPKTTEDYDNASTSKDDPQE